jgi:hypothetical protein
LVRIEPLEKMGATFLLGGNARVSFDSRRNLEVVLALTKATLALPDADLQRKRLELEHPASFVYANGRFEIPGMTLSGPRTHLELSGNADAAGMQLRMRGDLGLELLQAFLPAGGAGAFGQRLGGGGCGLFHACAWISGFWRHLFAGNRLRIASLEKPPRCAAGTFA